MKETQSYQHTKTKNRHIDIKKPFEVPNIKDCLKKFLYCYQICCIGDTPNKIENIDNPIFIQT